MRFQVGITSGLLALVLVGCGRVDTEAPSAGLAASTPPEWQFLSSVDAMTDEINNSARLRNEQGFSVEVYQVEDERWMLFSVSGTSGGTISSDDPPIVRIDKNEAIDLFKLLEMEEAFNLIAGINAALHGGEVFTKEYYVWEPGFVNFEILDEMLSQLIEGQSLVVRYTLGSGGTRDVTFDISRNKEAFKQALGISEDVSTME